MNSALSKDKAGLVIKSSSAPQFKAFLEKSRHWNDLVPTGIHNGDLLYLIVGVYWDPWYDYIDELVSYLYSIDNEEYYLVTTVPVGSFEDFQYDSMGSYYNNPFDLGAYAVHELYYNL